MSLKYEVLSMLDDVLSVGGRASRLHAASQLLDAVLELDSMAVVSLITTIEGRFAATIDDETRCSSRSSEVTSTRKLQSHAMKTTCSPFSSGFIGTITPPVTDAP